MESYTMLDVMRRYYPLLSDIFLAEEQRREPFRIEGISLASVSHASLAIGRRTSMSTCVSSSLHFLDFFSLFCCPSPNAYDHLHRLSAPDPT